MAYFSALGGTGGTSATITVTYSEDFYGVTITATNGTTTLTKTATSSGTLTFDVSEGGTWIVSGTVEGATYSEQVDVFFEYTVPPLVALPDGSTALPVNDIQMWLKCAAIRDKDYTTLSQVLADTETFIALCADSNACDYMARSTNWASGIAADSTAMLIVGKYNYCANALLSDSTWATAIGNSTYFESVLNVKVPVMTSATTPSGEVISSGQQDTSHYAYLAFDGNSNSEWISQYDTYPKYIGYKFTSPVIVNAFYVQAANNEGYPKAYTVQGSNTGNSDDWHEITSGSISQSDYHTGIKVVFSNTTDYTYTKLNFTDVDNRYIRMNTLQFYGRTDNANYIPLVPKMTSNTTPSGVASAGEENARAYYAFDGNPSTKWYSGSGVSGTVTYIGYQFPSAVEISAWGFAGNTDSPLLAPTKVVIQKSDDGVTYTDVQTFDNLPNDGQFHMYTLDSPITTAYIRAETYKRTVSGNTYAQFSRLQFYREPTIGEVLIHSAVEDSIFYMNDGSSVALCGIPVGDTIDVDLEAYKGQTLTLVSTVAKDPTNLSNDFSMNVRITPNITEIYLMPYGALYWWGHMYNCEDTTTANGWALTGSSPVSFIAPTHNKNSLTATSPSSYVWSGVGTKQLVSPSLTKLNAITTGISTGQYSEGEYLNMRANSGKSAAYATAYTTTPIKASAMTKTTATVTTSATYNAFLAAPWSSSGTIHAFWLE